MKNRILILVAAVAMALWALPALATCYDLTADNPSTGAISLPSIASGGFSSAATASFTLDTANNQLDIVFTNTDTSVTANSAQVLAALFWTSASAASGTGTASGVLIPSSDTSSQNISSYWGYHSSAELVGFDGTIAGNQGVGGAGLNYGFEPLDSSSLSNIDGLAYTLVSGLPSPVSKDLSKHEPYVYQTLTLALDLPTGTTEYKLCDPIAYWGTEPVSTVPIPGALLLLGGGLIRLAAYGRRRKLASPS